MSESLQDQLLKAGLIDGKSVKKHKKDKRKQAKQIKHSKAPIVDEQKERLQQADAEKRERDRALNQARLDALREKEIAAQIKQMIQHTKITSQHPEIDYNFTHGSHIRKLHVDAAIQKDLSRGRLAIVADDDHYAVVRADVAQKISERSPEYFTYTAKSDDNQSDEDDPYAAFVVPDDLVW